MLIVRRAFVLPSLPWTDKLAACPALLENPNPGMSPSPTLTSPCLVFLPLQDWPSRDSPLTHITSPLQKACYVVSTIGRGMYQLSTIRTSLPPVGPSVPYQIPLYSRI
jgi:hypothetical protein